MTGMRIKRSQKNLISVKMRKRRKTRRHMKTTMSTEARLWR